jgi:hypothetical protein
MVINNERQGPDTDFVSVVTILSKPGHLSTQINRVPLGKPTENSVKHFLLENNERKNGGPNKICACYDLMF